MLGDTGLEKLTGAMMKEFAGATPKPFSSAALAIPSRRISGHSNWWHHEHQTPHSLGHAEMLDTLLSDSLGAGGHVRQDR